METEQGRRGQSRSRCPARLGVARESFEPRREGKARPEWERSDTSHVAGKEMGRCESRRGRGGTGQG